MRTIENKENGTGYEWSESSCYPYTCHIMASKSSVGTLNWIYPR
jgi:hypothetical protein